MISIQLETFAGILPELKKVVVEHHKEVALDQGIIKLDPQYDTYLLREQAGETHVVTMRDAGELIGYYIGFIAPGLHYKECLTYVVDIFYVAPKYRRQGIAKEALQFLEKDLLRRGVRKVYMGSWVKADCSPLFESMGYIKAEVVFTKLLGG